MYMYNSGKGFAVIEMVVLLLGAMTAGGAIDDSNMDSSYSKIEQKLKQGNASAGIDYVSEASGELKDAVSTEILVMSMWERRSDGDMTLVVQNIGQKEVNTTTFTLVPVNRRPGEGNCFRSGNSTMLAPEEIYRCDTGIDFPQVYQEAKFDIILDGTSKSWRATCQPRTSETAFC
jgi:hypothetical protein